MSDNKDNEDDNFAKNFAKEYGKSAASDGIQKGGDKLFDKIKSTFRLKTSKKPISIKKYNGWGGNKYVKTYKVSGLLKKTLGSILNYGEAAYNLFKHGATSKEFAGSLGSSIGSVLAAGGAAAAMGSFFPGLGNLAGFVIGAGAAAIGSIGGEYIGEKIHDRISDMKNSENENEIVIPNNDNDNDLTGGGETGGVEFEIPKEISGFKQFLFFNKMKNQSIIFKNEFSNVNEILEVANKFIINNNIKFDSVNQVFQTILSEIYGGFIGEGVLPYVSLNFNNKSLLYSIMPNYYKKTLVGNILGYLDYF